MGILISVGEKLAAGFDLPEIKVLDSCVMRLKSATSPEELVNYFCLADVQFEAVFVSRAHEDLHATHAGVKHLW